MEKLLPDGYCRPAMLLSALKAFAKIVNTIVYVKKYRMKRKIQSYE